MQASAAHKSHSCHFAGAFFQTCCSAWLFSRTGAVGACNSVVASRPIRYCGAMSYTAIQQHVGNLLRHAVPGVRRCQQCVSLLLQSLLAMLAGRPI